MEIPGLKKGKRYEFWVKASNVVGEGRSSNVIAQTPNSNNVPARIIPFDEKVIIPWKSDITLSCKAVGTPVLERKWYHKDEIIQTSSRLYITNDGALVIKELLEEDNGDYYCVVTNDLSEDRVTYTIHVLLPPIPPTVEVVHSSSSSIELKWKLNRIVGQVKGYVLHVRREFGDWKEISLDADVASYKLNGLDCGTNYEIVMAAFNKIGLGDKSQPMLAPTNGSAPGPPPKEDLLEETASSVSINLNAWKIHSCPILYYIVEYKVRGTSEWVFAANNVKPEQKRLVVRDLTPATWYQLRITAHSSAGSSVGEYNFATMTMTGATISPNVMLQDEADNMSSSPKVDLWVAVTVILSVLLVIVVLALTCLFVKKGNCGNNRKAPSCGMRQEMHRGTLSRPHTEFGTMSSAGYLDDPVPYASCGLGSFSTGTLPHSGGCPAVPPRQLDHFDTLNLQHKFMLGNSGFSPVQSNPSETTFLFPQVASGMPCVPHASAAGFPPKA